MGNILAYLVSLVRNLDNKGEEMQLYIFCLAFNLILINRWYCRVRKLKFSWMAILRLTGFIKPSMLGLRNSGGPSYGGQLFFSSNTKRQRR